MVKKAKQAAAHKPAPKTLADKPKKGAARKTSPTPSPPAAALDVSMADTVKASAQQIWLAGLGAFAKAQQEGGKVFDALVKEGVTLQRRTQSTAGDRLGEINGRLSSMAGDVGARAGQQWDKLESIFEERVQRALGKMGIPTAADVAALTARIEALEAAAEKSPAAPFEAAKPKRPPRSTAI